MKFKKGTLPYIIKDRIEYLYRFKELLRLYHNYMGQEYKKNNITLEQFRIFQTTWYSPRDKAICKEIVHCRQVFAQKNIPVDFADIEEE